MPMLDLSFVLWVLLALFVLAVLALTFRYIPNAAHTDARTERCGQRSFQDPEKFLQAGGLRGRQLQTLVEGTYYINRLFATVEMVPKTVVEVGNVGVVVSYTGEAGVDLTGDQYKHGELVKRHTRGVWSEPLLPGKYAFNTYAGKTPSCICAPSRRSSVW